MKTLNYTRSCGHGRGLSLHGHSTARRPSAWRQVPPAPPLLVCQRSGNDADVWSVLVEFRSASHTAQAYVCVSARTCENQPMRPTVGCVPAGFALMGRWESKERVARACSSERGRMILGGRQMSNTSSTATPA